MSTTGALFLLLPVLVGLCLAFAAIGVGIFFLVRYLLHRSAKKRQREEQDRKDREMDRMKLDDL